MRLKSLEISGFKSFGKTVRLILDKPIVGIVGPNGSGKSNVVEAIRFALGEQSIKSLRGGTSTDMLFRPGNGGRGAVMASVTLTFDNSDGVFRIPQLDAGSGISFEEIVVRREIDSEGVQKYSINGTVVRMRDIVELIGSVNIGSSGHHIISQGEADRFLFSSQKERRILLEEALGLKLYHIKIAETERKLQKSNESLREAKLLQKEIEPHLKFLTKQVQKIHEADEIRKRLAEQSGYYRVYTANLVQAWQGWVEGQTQSKKDSLVQIQSEKQAISLELSRMPVITDDAVEQNDFIQKIEVHQLQATEIVKKITRIEYDTEQTEKQIRTLQSKSALLQKQPEKPTHIRVEIMNDLIATLNQLFEKMKLVTIVTEYQLFITRANQTLSEYTNRLHPEIDHAQIESIKNEIGQLTDTLDSNRVSLGSFQRDLAVILEEKKSLEVAKSLSESNKREARKREYELGQKLAEYDIQIRSIQSDILRTEESLVVCEDFLAECVIEFSELDALVGDMQIHPEQIPEIQITTKPELDTAMRSVSQLRRDIERSKIRLEELGIISAPDILLEHTSATDRYEFLSREITDSESTITQLQPLLAELRNTVKTEFTTGIQAVNTEFSRFFTAMFGGGSAVVTVVDITKKKKKSEGEPEESVVDESDQSEVEQGIDINVKIPNKKAGDLSILSGGERSLTSIALLFALSQVNPPPFIVLDETDAALDESNSRRYGQLIGQLSSLSQILVVTHNRETMSHCDVLYGVTLGQDSASQVFGVRFDEAVQYAK